MGTGTSPADGGLHGLPGLEESDGGSRGVGEDGHPAYAGNLHRSLVDGGAERLGLVGGGVDLFDADVGEPEGGHSGHGEEAAAGAGRGLEGAVDAGRTHVVVFKGPAEEAGVELFGFGDVGGAEFEVNEGIGHRSFLRLDLLARLGMKEMVAERRGIWLETECLFSMNRVDQWAPAGALPGRTFLNSQTTARQRNASRESQRKTSTNDHREA